MEETFEKEISGQLIPPTLMQQARVLIVDDSEANLILIRKMLERAGYRELKVLNDARSALSEVASFQPDAVLLDLHMPYVSGLELLEKLRAEPATASYLPVLLLTANPSKELKRRALEQGATDFLQRPFDPDEVLLKLRNALHTRALHQQLQEQNLTLAEQVEARTRTLREQEVEAKLHAKRAQQLADLSARLEVINEPRLVAREGLHVFMDLWSFDLGVLYRFENNSLVPSLTVGEVPPQVAGWIKTLDVSLPGALQRRVMTQEEPVVIDDYSAWEHATPGLKQLNLRTVIGFPLRIDGKLCGVMYVSKFGETIDVDQNAHTVLRAIQLRIERALERIHLLENLRDTREDALRVVGLTLEYRDYETKGHTDRVTRLAQQLGAAVGLGPACDHLTWGGYLHDTGKIAIPDQILLKPGKLTDSEFDYIKTHVTIGAQMLSNLKFLPAEVLEIVKFHHERWDGRGYPDGLAGEDIPYLARIFSIADVYDALTSKRPYKEPWSHDAALAEIVRQQGKQFDPDLVDAFVALFEEGAGEEPACQQDMAVVK